MFPNVPTDDKALKIVKEYLIKHRSSIDLFGLEVSHVMLILDFVLKNTYTKINGKFYKGHSGVSTGGHSSTAYADIIVDWTYIKALPLSYV